MNGIAEAFQYVILYPDPNASFSAYPVSATRKDQVFRFLNKSEGAVKYFWDFGDGNTSAEPDPSHVYGKEGTFNIMLTAWSEHDCPDTLLNEKYIKVKESMGKILFPNAFRWNGTGPTGGYWSEKEIDNTVFHPHFQNVDEYNLVIYSRWGELLYESFDLYKGWDGYFNNANLAPQGVYVYKAWVTYTDGRQEVKVGDVTFLH
jgi:PKD repeat protein